MRCDQARWIIELSEESTKGKYKNSGREFKKAFHAFVTSFGNMLAGVGEQYERVGKYLKSKKDWLHFKDNELRIINERENTQIGGKINRDERPRAIIEKESEGANKAKFNTLHIDNKEIKGDEGLDLDEMEDFVPNKITDNDCADNNYWRTNNYMKLEDLELDYE